jgi:hypothetical protein
MATDALKKASRETIIEVIKNDGEYYSGVGKNFLSNSDIDALLTNPKEFGKPREDNSSFAKGRLFHQLLIEPEKAKATPFVDVSTRTTKEYKNFCENNNMPFCLLKKEVDEIMWLASAIKANIEFYDEIYKPGNVYEQPGIGEIHGIMWKGKADIITDEMIIDLKTTSDIKKFKWSAKSYNYDSQCYIYQQLFGKPLVFFVVDKITGQLGIFRPTENFIKGGEEKVIKAIEVWSKYYGPNPTDDIDNYYIDEMLD